MPEIDLIRRIKQLSGSRWIGDDCAVLPQRPGEDLLVTTDFLVENVHFRRRVHSAEDCGWRLMARGLSDIAAMGGVPRYAFVSLALAKWADDAWLDGFYQGLLKLARHHRVQLAGGDLTRAALTAADIVVLGAVPRGAELRRSGARPGDRIYVSGALGRAAASKWRDLPEPRLALGRYLRGKASACMDLSDGLALDLHRLCLESRCAAAIDDVPVHPGATPEQALSGGDDYELLFTAPPAVRIPRSLRGLPLSPIGVITKGPAGQVRRGGRPLTPTGWDSFRRRSRRANSAASGQPDQPVTTG
jgi:thiamine-monophosphate kinase